jgi:outer membrane protein, heavy metal efflux system
VTHDTRSGAQRGGCLTFALVLAFATPGVAAAEDVATVPEQLAALVAEALANNPEVEAAQSELDAARERVSAAGALDDPMLELGIVNAPVGSLDMRQEDMTMKMLGIGQRLPFPGKRDLRRAVAAADAESIGLAVQETFNRIERDVRVAYEELAFNAEAQRIVVGARGTLQQSAGIARSQYAVGSAAQTDVLDAQIGVERLNTELLRLTGESAVLQGEMRRLLGRTVSSAPIHVPSPQLAVHRVVAVDHMNPAIDNRPQLQALQALVERDTTSIDLAERESYSDFDLKLQYGQRDSAPDGTGRDDLVSLTVEFNLPIWRKSKVDPQVAETLAMRRRAQNMLQAQRLETQAALETQLALVRQSRAIAELYKASLLPQVRAAVTSTLAAYRVGRVDFLTLRQSQLREFEVSTELARAIASHNKAIAEIDLLVGRGVAALP